MNNISQTKFVGLRIISIFVESLWKTLDNKVWHFSWGWNALFFRHRAKSVLHTRERWDFQNVALESLDNNGVMDLGCQNGALNVVLDGVLKQIMQHISHNRKITIKELATTLELSERQIDRYLKYLRENGFLDRTKNNRYGEWIIKK